MEIETGYIYCISNLDIMPGIYKVGVTMRSPLDRLKEANSSDTWKIPSYKIEFAKKVTNPKDKERTLHRLMEKFMKRVHPRREFFRGDINDIKEAFQLMDGDIWNEKPPEPVIRDGPISIENRLSEDPDIRIRQIMELIQQVFNGHTVHFKENGKLSGHNHYPVIVDNLPIFIIENHNNGGRNVAMLTTIPRNRAPDLINDYYSKLTWDAFGNLPRAIRKQYDTEGKTKEDIINLLEGFKTILPKQDGGTPREFCDYLKDYNSSQDKKEIMDIENEKLSVFSNDCYNAVKELLSVLKNRMDFLYTNHNHKGVINAYYSIINPRGLTVFYLEDHSENNINGLRGMALITTPPPGGIIEEFRHKYYSVTDNWLPRSTSRSIRKRYDIRGKNVEDVIDIFNHFR